MEVLFARPVRVREIIARALLAPLFNSLLTFQKKVRTECAILLLYKNKVFDTLFLYFLAEREGFEPSRPMKT